MYTPLLNMFVSYNVLRFISNWVNSIVVVLYPRRIVQ